MTNRQIFQNCCGQYLQIIWNLVSGVFNLCSGIWYLESEIWNGLGCPHFARHYSGNLD